MADNVAVQPSGATNAIDVATDEINGIHHPQYLMEYGVDGTATRVSSTTPLPTTMDALLVSSLSESTARAMVRELRILNAHMALITDTHIEREDVE